MLGGVIAFLLEKRTRVYVLTIVGFFFIGSRWKFGNRYILVLQGKIRRGCFSLSLSCGQWRMFGYLENIGTLFLSQF